MVWVRFPVYFHNRNSTYYFTRGVPSDLRNRFPKRKIEVSSLTRSASKAARFAAAVSDRLERYWDSLRIEMIYPKELALTVLPETITAASDSFSLTDALALYHRLNGKGNTSLLCEASDRSGGYLIKCISHRYCSFNGHANCIVQRIAKLWLFQSRKSEGIAKM
tara:strand:- start:214 stop:705 length:492 start_codon:yes stop_codon:yes gene_type:complete